MDKDTIQKAVKDIISAVGDDPGRPELQATPERVADMFGEILSCTGKDLLSGVKVLHEDHGEQMILVKDIQFYSMCEHHLMPFFGKVHVVYLPKENRIIGFSKICQMVECAAKRLQIQERMCTQIADALMSALEPHGVMVIMEAEHLCMTMRGTKKPGTSIKTSAIRGIFYDDSSARAEALALLG